MGKLGVTWENTLDSSMASDRFVVEADRRVVGVAVRVPGGFRFFSSHPDFLALEGKIFARARSIAHRAAQIRKRRRRFSAASLAPAARRGGE